MFVILIGKGKKYIIYSCLGTKHREKFVSPIHILVLLPEELDLLLHLLADVGVELLLVVDLDTVGLDHEVDVGPIILPFP